MYIIHRCEIIHLTWRFAHASRNLFCDTTENVIKHVCFSKAVSDYGKRKLVGIDE